MPCVAPFANLPRSSDDIAAPLPQYTDLNLFGNGLVYRSTAVSKATEQLNVTDVQIFLKHENGGLILSEPVQAETSDMLVFSARELVSLEKGDVVIQANKSNCSLYLPLVLKRASKPEFLGVIAFGKRQNGMGYSSSVNQSLKKFGVDAGKALYGAKLRESSGKNIIERLSSIEKGLANLKTDLA